jgi:biotin carboxyl carrier protein
LFAVEKKGLLYLEVNGWKTQLSPSFIMISKGRTNEEKTLPGSESEVVLSPMHGKIINVKVPRMKQVKKGEVIMILESMKMENNICATCDGYVQDLFVNTGEQVDKDAPLVSLGTNRTFFS